jgi:hypothetical protein
MTFGRNGYRPRYTSAERKPLEKHERAVENARKSALENCSVPKQLGGHVGRRPQSLHDCAEIQKFGFRLSAVPTEKRSEF